MFAAEANDLIGVDVAPFNDGGLQLFYPELHGGDLLDQRLFRLGEGGRQVLRCRSRRARR